MGQVSLVATADFPYAGRKFSKGDRFEAPEKDAHLLKITRKAVEAPVPVLSGGMKFRELKISDTDAPFINSFTTRDISPEPDAPIVEPVKTKRQYHRRDLTAEP